MTSSDSCSCGCTERHVIAKRETADGRRLRVWSDGALTHAVPGDPLVRGIGTSRSRYARERDRRAVLDVLDSLSLFDLAELPRLMHAARAEQKHRHASDESRRAQILRVAVRACEVSTTESEAAQ